MFNWLSSFLGGAGSVLALYDADTGNYYTLDFFQSLDYRACFAVICLCCAFHLIFSVLEIFVRRF